MWFSPFNVRSVKLYFSKQKKNFKSTVVFFRDTMSTIQQFQFAAEIYRCVGNKRRQDSQLVKTNDSKWFLVKWAPFIIDGITKG